MTVRHVVAARALFGSCRYVVEDLCPRFGIACTLVDGVDLDRRPAKPGADHRQFRVALGHHPPQRGEFVGGSWRGGFHAQETTRPRPPSPCRAAGRTRCRVTMSQPNQCLRQHAAAGRAVHAGMRQSIPSVSIASCAAVSVSVPSLACGQTNRPRSSRLA